MSKLYPISVKPSAYASRSKPNAGTTSTTVTSHQ